MSDDIGPWGARNPPPPEPPQRRRLRPLRLGPIWVWLCLLGALAALIAALVHAFPEAVHSHQDWARVGYSTGLVVLIGAGMLRAGRGFRGVHLRYAAIWALILAGLALGFAYRTELAGVPDHLRVAFSDGTPVATGEHELIVPQDPQGGFAVIGLVNGQRVRFVVDTGASDTVLSPDDAKRVGFDPAQLHYVRQAETANGDGFGAPVQLRRFEVGPIGLDNFEVVVNQAPISTSLLGLSFLNRLESFQVKDHKLVLKWRNSSPPA
jgi:aspartyl protease family protein